MSDDHLVKYVSTSSGPCQTTIDGICEHMRGLKGL